MSVPRQHQDALTARLQTMLEPITDADSRTLAEYITALLDQGPPSDLLDNLSEFLGDHTRPFVDAVSAMLLSGDYLPAHLRPAVPDVAPAPAPGPEPTAASSSNNIRSPSTRDHRDRSGDRIGDRSRDRPCRDRPLDAATTTTVAVTTTTMAYRHHRCAETATRTTATATALPPWPRSRRVSRRWPCR
ncbi:hypothetical protein BC828DRAFT_26611 [Blastocladiella britannica]|nr:hypothetical protein BC828DRAFT_26611 [Blastocladiella britannica]